MIEHIGMFDAKTRFSEIVRMVKETGRRVIVTNRGEEMVEIVPIGASGRSGRSRENAFDEIERLRRLRGRSTHAENREDVERGRM